MKSRFLNPYVFVTGCTRSGTTLLQRMLDNHPQLAVSNDTHVVLIPRAVLGSGPRGDVPLTGPVIEQVTSFKRFGNLGIDEATAARLAAATDTLGAFASALFDEFAHRQGKPFGGEKDPEYVRHLPFFTVFSLWHVASRSSAMGARWRCPRSTG